MTQNDPYGVDGLLNIDQSIPNPSQKQMKLDDEERKERHRENEKGSVHTRGHMRKSTRGYVLMLNMDVICTSGSNSK